jgi:hypothetical protein
MRDWRRRRGGVGEAGGKEARGRSCEDRSRDGIGRKMSGGRMRYEETTTGKEFKESRGECDEYWCRVKIDSTDTFRNMLNLEDVKVLTHEIHLLLWHTCSRLSNSVFHLYIRTKVVVHFVYLLFVSLLYSVKMRLLFLPACGENKKHIQDLCGTHNVRDLGEDNKTDLRGQKWDTHMVVKCPVVPVTCNALGLNREPAH